MKKTFPILLLVLTVLIGAALMTSRQGELHAETLASTDGPEWFVRCGEGYKEGTDKRGMCEVFQRQVMVDTNQRLIEFALGYKKDKKDASGIIILPLGILLEPGVEMKVDDGRAFKFKVRYCDVGGCVAYVSLNKKIVNMMRKGEKALIMFQSAESKKMTIELSLRGFTKAIDQIS